MEFVSMPHRRRGRGVMVRGTCLILAAMVSSAFFVAWVTASEGDQEPSRESPAASEGTANPRAARQQTKRLPSLSGLPDQDRDHSGVVPKVLTDASIPLPHEGKITELGVYRAWLESEAAPEPKAPIYCVEPVFALVPADHPFPGLGPLVRGYDEGEKEKGDEDITYLTFTFRLNLDLVYREAEARINRSLIEGAFLDRQAKLAVVEGRPKFAVRPFPVVEVVMFCQSNRKNERPFAKGVVGVRNQLRDVDVTMPFNPSALADFLDCQRKGTLEFVPVYHFRGLHTVTARSDATISAKMVQEAVSKLGSGQKSGTAPIFQNDVNEVYRRLSGEIIGQVGASDHSILDSVDVYETFLIGTVFDSGKWMSPDDLKGAFRDYSEQMLSAYLKPQIETSSSTGGNVDTTSRGEAQEDLKVKQVGSGVSIPMVGSNKTQRQEVSNRLKNLETTHGTEFRWDEASQSYRLHQIRVFRVAAGLEEQEIKKTKVFQVGIGENRGYFESTPVSQFFTTKLLDKVLADRIKERGRAEGPSREALLEEIGRLKGELAALKDRPTKIEPASLTVDTTGLWPHASGDMDLQTDVNASSFEFSSRLAHDGHVAWMEMHFMCMELVGDGTRFGLGPTNYGTGRPWGYSLVSRDDASVYRAPPGWRIREIRTRTPSTFTHHPMPQPSPICTWRGQAEWNGVEAELPKGAFRGKQSFPLPSESYWDWLKYQVDVEGADHMSVGVLGKVSFQVVLEAESGAPPRPAPGDAQAPMPVTRGRSK